MQYFKECTVVVGSVLKHEVSLIRCGSPMIAVSIVIAACALVWPTAVKTRLWSILGNDSADQLQVTCILVAGALLVGLLRFLAILPCKRRVQKMCQFILGVGMATFMFAITAVLVLAWYSFLGIPHQPQPRSASDLWGGSDSGMLLAVDWIIAVAHLSMPEHWLVSLPVDVVGALLYVAM